MFIRMLALILAKRDYGTQLGASEYHSQFRQFHSLFSLVTRELALILAKRDYGTHHLGASEYHSQLRQFHSLFSLVTRELPLFWRNGTMVLN